MGRLILVLLVIAVVVLVWKAFKPSTWKNTTDGGFLSIGRTSAQHTDIKGPDDDDAFLWELDKARFKREREEERRLEAERRRRERQALYEEDPTNTSTNHDSTDDGTADSEL